MNAAESVDVLLQALPYIQRFHGRVMVIKFGGNAMTSPELFDRFAEDIVLMHSVGIRPVIVHGGGPQIGEWLRRLGKSSEFVDGQRVTDSETLEVVQMVLIGKVNSDIVSALNVHGPVAVGLSGQDAGLIEAEARHPDLGFVGDVTGINPTVIPLLMTVCVARSATTPTATSLPNGSRVPAATEIPPAKRSSRSPSAREHPINPQRSPSMQKTKSVWPAGR